MAAKKVLVLGLLLLMPVLVFLFLSAFGHNAYKLRTYLPEPMAAARVGAQPVSDTVFHRVADYVVLADAAGSPLNPARDLRGRIVVLGFGDAACTTDACRNLLHGLVRAQERFRAEPAVKLLYVAPAGPPADLATLAERTGAIGGKWHFAAADAAAYAALRRELRETATEAPPSRLWLLDRQRYLRGVYNGQDPRDVARLLTEVEVLLEIEQNPARQ